MRVLMIGPDRSVHGGISGVVNNYYEAGLDQLVDLYYIGTMKEGSKLYKLLVAVKALCLFICKLHSYDIVHVNVASDASYYRKSIFIKLAKQFHKKIVIHQHGGDFEGFYTSQLDDKGRQKVQKILSMGDAFIALSPIAQAFFATIIDEEKIYLLPNAILLPKEMNKTYGQHQLLFLGRICKTKGIGELLEVIPDLMQQYPDLKLYLAGIWEDENLRKQAEAYPEHIIWTGWITGEEKEQYLRQCDIFVLPTYFEGQPVSVLEAMAYGCACVVSNTGGIPQMVETNQTGILVEPRNKESLKEGLLQALQNVDLCKQLGTKARLKIEECFSLERSLQELIAIYRRIEK